jgi:hypothetical protein
VLSCVFEAVGGDEEADVAGELMAAHLLKCRA